jgi:hypothetical protein
MVTLYIYWGRLYTIFVFIIGPYFQLCLAFNNQEFSPSLMAAKTSTVHFNFFLLLVLLQNIFKVCFERFYTTLFHSRLISYPISFFLFSFFFSFSIVCLDAVSSNHIPETSSILFQFCKQRTAVYLEKVVSLTTEKHVEIVFGVNSREG